jgi:hypothetical protein
MAQDLQLRVPFDPGYTARLGTAIYLFAYYEWTIIYIIDYLQPGFVSTYSRGKPITSGKVAERLESVINDQQTSFQFVSKDELTAVHASFTALVEQRNALIHAHPSTDTNGDQILNYQGRTTRPVVEDKPKPISDMKWPVDEITRFTVDVDEAACEAGDVLDKLR